MEADWELEIGGDFPVIDGLWAGFVDLRMEPERVGEVGETRELPALAAALVRLNDRNSNIWTAKTDVFVADAIDRFELDAASDEAAHALACYIDLLPRSDRQWVTAAEAAQACESLCARLHRIGLRCCRTDMIIRRAVVAPEVSRLGITVYCVGCGPNEEEAKARLAQCVGVLAETLVPAPLTSFSKLQW